MRRIGIFFLLLIFLFQSIKSNAQPANDNCANATPITIGDGGYALGTFTSAQQDMTSATQQTGESFAPSITVAGLNKKSVWYKFSVPTTRSMRVSLLQPGSAIQAGNVGFAVYKASNCVPLNGQISTKLTPIETFGNTFHPCVETGDYLVQVSGNNAANGKIYITVEIAEPSPALYDKPSTAQKFGKVSTNKITAVDFYVECQTLDNAAENCSPNGSLKDFTKSTWHTFKTPDYFDWFSVLLSENYTTNYYDDPYTVGYRIYEGDVSTTSVGSLTLLGGCDSMKTNGYYPDQKMYKCGQLKTNTTYTIQFLYHKDFMRTMRLAVAWNGTAATKGPQPVTLSTPNNMGTLSASAYGTNNTATDNFACNARHSLYNCPKTLPVKGINVSGWNYNMSSFFSFKLSGTSSLNISVNTGSPGPLLRLYRQKLTTACTDLDTVNLIGDAVSYLSMTCLDPGDYVLQVMGVDTTFDLRKSGYYYGHLYTSAYPMNIMGNLGNAITVNIQAITEITTNKFSLSASGKFDKLNAVAGVMKPLVAYQQYVSAKDTFGCANTVLPDDNGICKSPYGEPMTKASYREFEVTDSFMLQIKLPSPTWIAKLYKGNANDLAVAQSAFDYPEKITGLTPYTKCLNGYESKYACITSGTYTLVSLDNRMRLESTVEVTPRKTKAKFASPATALDMGSLWDQLGSDGVTMSAVDTFICYDNPATIDGLAPCNDNAGKPTQKLAYRQFYLNEPALVYITNYYYYYGKSFSGRYSLFKGKATDGLATLKTMGTKWTCFTSANSDGQCDALPAGWYTVVSYGGGPSFAEPTRSSISDSYFGELGQENGFYIRLTKPCPDPQFNRPHKASVDTVTKKPYLIQWGPQTGHTAAYPVTYKKYTLDQENLNCTEDTAFIRQYMQKCNAENVKVAFYVFETTQESFVQLEIPDGLWGAVYDFDVRTKDSTKLKTDQPFQTCLNKGGQIQICKLQPGKYTLVFFAPSSYTCHTVTPTIYIDQVGYSRFDHASNSYDFGTIKADSIWYNGKPGDKNPLNTGRAASNDFFYCTTGAQEKDPADAACMSKYNPEIYTAGDNVVMHPDNAKSPVYYEIDRRNLWYTFTINQPGTVRIKVDNKTAGKTWQYPFAVYKSDVDGGLPFSSVVSSGLVDSTLLQGLSFVGHNLYYYYYCNSLNDISFYNDPCSFKPTRYYILVENRNPYGYGNVHDMNPNHQVEVSVLLDQADAIATKFDHYSQANDMSTVNSGKKKGATDNFTCATRDLPDPLYAYTQCQKTLWYKFTTTTTGQIRYAAFFKGQYQYYYDHIQLFRKIKDNDSSSTGLQHMPYTTTYYNNGNWAQQCISPGTYYIILPGCNALNEDVYPEIEIIPQAGDFCSAPMVTNLNGAGTKVVSVTVDCHTIGTDYGEFNPTLTCPAGGKTSDYKTSWYRLDIGGKDTLDVTVYINEKTNAGSTDIKYRMMTGTCGAMQEQSCVQDALTRNTYKCLAPGNSYYIQVFTPELISNYYQVTGDIDLNISAVKHADTCLPAANCIAVANFTPEFDCTKDRDVTFTNFSTYGSDIKYEWNFGYNNQKSNAVSPKFFYPALTTAKTYNVKLIVTNTSCGKKDSITQSVTIPARPAVNLGRDTVICTNGASISYDVTSHSGATYYWYNGSTQPTATWTYTQNPWVEITYKGCVARDTVNIWINPVAKKDLQTVALCNVDKVTLNSNRGYGEQFKWNTGATTYSIEVSQPGYYWVDLYLNGCTIRDSFLVVSTDLRPLGKDITVCQGNMPYTADATVSGASAYQWQNGTTSATFSVTKPGVYWVDISLSGCTFRDSLMVKVDSFKTATVKATICEGQKYQLPGGRFVTVAATYKDTLKNIRGCDSLITTVTLAVDMIKRINTDVSICAGQSYTLPSGKMVTTANTYADTVRNIRDCDSIISVINLTVANVKRENKSVTLCKGQSYTMPSGKTVMNQAVYSDTLKARAGCDSLITTVDLRILSPIVNTYTTSVCFGKTFTMPGGRVVSSSGFYKDTIKYVNGCDSLISNITVSIGTAIIENKKVFVCEGQSYILPGGRQVNTTAIYKDTARNVAGCDSLISTIDLTMQSVARKNSNAFICGGGNYTLPSGKRVNATGIYNDTLRYKSGCDSVITTVDLKVYNAIVNTANAIICSGKTYTLPSGRIVNANGLYRDTLRYANGCDSLITNITLKVTAPLQETKTAYICQGNVYQLPSGRIVSTAAIYKDTARSITGCDSLVSTITVIVDAPQKQTLNPAICKDQEYALPSGRLVYTAGIYLDTLHNSRGCDSLHYTINLQVNNATKEEKSITLCNGESHTLPLGKIVNAAGVYRDTLKTLNGCDSIIITTISVRPALTVTLSGNKNICSGGSTTISAIVTGGNGGPYSYSWTGSNSNSNSITISPITTTKYKLTVSDGCTVQPAIDSITINVTALPDAKITTSTKAGCGSLKVNFTNNTVNVNWQWDFGTDIATDISSQRNPSFTYQQPGTYIVKLQVTTPNGCKSESSETIIVSETPTASIKGLPQICAGTSTSFTGQVDNPTGIKWNWDFGNNATSTVQNPMAQLYPLAGNYTIRLIATNAVGCSDTVEHALKVAALPVPGLNGAEAKICAGTGTTLNAQGGTGYQWTPAGGLSNTTIADPVANPATDTRYYVTVTDAAGCEAIDSIFVKVIQPFSLTTSANTFVCAGASVNLQASGAVRYEWTGQGLSQSTGAVVKATPASGFVTYTVKAYGANDCFTQTANIVVDVIPLPIVDAGKDTIVMVGSSFSLLPTYSTDVKEYNWSPSTNLDCISCPFPVAMPREDIPYKITVKNDHHCEASDTRTITLLCNNESVFVPNTFTPNGDGVNDIFYPRGNGIRSVKYLRVYNRWGQLIFEKQNFNTDDKSAGWNGTFKGQPLAPDVYVYTLAMVCDNNQVVETKGNIMIVR
ncbi:gliding motility-associated C-terminal domain-containing protein [Terrimonas pollutisoli]|uniref:gliding motility-associated C-terminal domain-containing protein n=1 Tax=Terrimonas pollutisoli TaxID=3034147 RepID=UPI0023EB4826|nr:PKD domain-containing protein [Terrimonas sp. H1YJ31]